MPWKTCVFMCVCVCKTHWLALKKKKQMSCQSRQLFDAFERSKYAFQLSKTAYDAKKKPSTTYVLRDTFPPIFRCVVNQNGVLNLVPLLFEWCGLLGQLTRFWNTNISICSACVTFAFLSHLVKWYKAIILNYGFVKVPIKKLQTKDETDL